MAEAVARTLAIRGAFHLRTVGDAEGNLAVLDVGLGFSDLVLLGTVAGADLVGALLRAALGEPCGPVLRPRPCVRLTRQLTDVFDL